MARRNNRKFVEEYGIQMRDLNTMQSLVTDRGLKSPEQILDVKTPVEDDLVGSSPEVQAEFEDTLTEFLDATNSFIDDNEVLLKAIYAAYQAMQEDLPLQSVLKVYYQAATLTAPLVGDAKGQLSNVASSLSNQPNLTTVESRILTTAAKWATEDKLKINKGIVATAKGWIGRKILSYAKKRYLNQAKESEVAALTDTLRTATTAIQSVQEVSKKVKELEEQSHYTTVGTTPTAA